jgi:hypothetical protein
MRGNLTQILQRHLWAGEAGRLIERHWGRLGGPGSKWPRRDFVSLIQSSHLHRPSDLIYVLHLLISPCRIQYKSVCCQANKWSHFDSSLSQLPRLTL